MILVDIGSSIPNGLNNEANDAASLAGTTKAGASGWTNALVTGGAPGVSGQSTLSRKSGKEILTHPFDLFFFFLATSAKIQKEVMMLEYYLEIYLKNVIFFLHYL